MNLKQWSAAFLLLSFMAQVLSSPFIVFDYYVNTATYATNCENKTKPELQCNGKCQMAKELKKQEEKEQQFPGNEGSLKSMVSLFAKSGFASAPVVMLWKSKQEFTVIHNFYTNDISFPVFHPPAQHSSVI